jgi:hypothetical protein
VRRSQPYYDHRHRARRTALLKQAIGTPCPGALVHGQPWRSRHCDGVMVNPHRMHLDHTTPLALGGTVGDRICCQPCNTGAGAKLGHQRRRTSPGWRSRDW